MSTGEFLLYFTVSLFLVCFIVKKKKQCYRIFFVLSCVPYFYCRIACPVGFNCDQMEEAEQYSEYSVERNPRAYMSMRDYRSLPWHNQQPLGRNPNTYRSMKDYRTNGWVHL